MTIDCINLNNITGRAVYTFFVKYIILVNLHLMHVVTWNSISGKLVKGM